jgi:hypothetical protein
MSILQEMLDDRVFADDELKELGHKAEDIGSRRNRLDFQIVRVLMKMDPDDFALVVRVNHARIARMIERGELS